MSPARGPPPHIGSGHGWRWFTGALTIVRRWPWVFLSCGLTLGIIGTFPYIGALVMLILGPALLAGVCVAAHAAATGRTPTWGQLFALFADPGRRGEAIKLCIPLVVTKIVAALMLGIAVTQRLAAQGVDLLALEGHPEKLVALLRTTLVSEAMYPWLLAAVVIVAFGWTFVVLATPQVALSRTPAWRAMGESFRAVWGHLGAWIVAVLAWFVCLLALFVVLQLTRLPVIVQLGVATAAYAMLGPMLYLAWRELGGTPTDAGDGPPPASRPPAPPPPSGILRA